MNAPTLDRIRGMFAGAFLGDALGAPYEFNRSTFKVPYTGRLDKVTTINTRFLHLTLVPGQCTDDTEMSITLLRSILRTGRYDREATISDYIDWTNSTSTLGVNTRELFKGIKAQDRSKRIRTYSDRLRTKYTGSQSNGSLMRATPLALLWNNQDVLIDTGVTNPNPVNFDSGLVYVAMLRLALQGVDGFEILRIVGSIIQTPQLRAVYEEVFTNRIRPIVESKGWILHAMWCTMAALYHRMTYSQAMEWIITSQPGSDTDTNACICGGVLGAIAGYDQLRSNPITRENLEVMISRDLKASPTPRPSQYGLNDFDTLTEQAWHLSTARYQELLSRGDYFIPISN